MHRFLFALAGLLLVAATPPAGAFEIRNCGPQASEGMRMAAGFVTRHMSTIVDDYTFLSAKQRQEIVVKWPNLKLECEDQVSQCRKSAGGYAHGGPGNRVNICYRNKVDDGERVCDLVRSIMHESGHAHGFRPVRGHNDATAYIRANDSMYRMGEIAENHCLAIRPVNQLMPGTVRIAIGGICDKNSECQSSLCEKGICACNDDGDCSSALPICHKRATKANFCGRDDKAVGERCSVNAQCGSGKCQNDVCVCTENRDCTGADRPVCHKQAFKPNFCGSSQKTVGQTCTKDDQCASGACQYGRCACKSNSDCRDDAIPVCHKRTLRWNFCGATDKPVGASCSVDAQCRSNRCKSDRCVAN